jgi:leucyl-tRNA synthetase
MRDCGYLDMPSGEPFAGLFTLGMVTHETYRAIEIVDPARAKTANAEINVADDAEGIVQKPPGALVRVDYDNGAVPRGTIVRVGEWLSPDEIEKKDGKAFESAAGKPAEIGGVEKISKSKRNGPHLQTYVKEYGADVLRWFVLSDSPPDREVEWSTASVEGAWRFTQRIWGLIEAHGGGAPGPGEPPPPGADDGEALALRRIAHRAVQAVGEGIEGFRFNSAVARCYELVNAIAKVRDAADAPTVWARGEALRLLVQAVAPFMPHLAEECWAALGFAPFVSTAPWPAPDPALVARDVVTMPVQVNGKKRAEIEIAKGLAEEAVRELALADARVAPHVKGLNIRKVVVVPDRIVNIVVG